MERDLAQCQEAGVWIQPDPFHILWRILYLMAFLPCKSYQKLANNSITETDARASGKPPLQTAVNHQNGGFKIGRDNKVWTYLCLYKSYITLTCAEPGEATSMAAMMAYLLLRF